jgi:hypothetical protein
MESRVLMEGLDHQLQKLESSDDVLLSGRGIPDQRERGA